MGDALPSMIFTVAEGLVLTWAMLGSRTPTKTRRIALRPCVCNNFGLRARLDDGKLGGGAVDDLRVIELVGVGEVDPASFV